MVTWFPSKENTTGDDLSCVAMEIESDSSERFAIFAHLSKINSLFQHNWWPRD